MAIPPDKATRDANLDALQSATTDWFTKEKERIEKENQFLQQILQARGANDASALNLDEAVNSMEVEISAYLFIGNPSGT